MSDINEKCLEVFPDWLKSLGEDVGLLLSVLKTDGVDTEARRFVAGGINYLFKSLDLIPDGIDDIGYLDDAFVLRMAAKAAVESGVGSLSGPPLERLNALAEDAALVEEFLEADIFTRFDTYTRGLTKGAARGRMVDEIVENASVFKEFAAETSTFAEEYTSPGFSQDSKNLVKLKAFFDAKLPK
jgi:uncharacterized membrane protein YkvA (DUF1232 family)